MNNRHLVILGAVLLAGGAAWGIQDPSDTVERTMTFVDKSAEATELLSSGKTQEALAVFQDLQSRYGDLDQDGYVAMSIGDCLTTLGRLDEARQAYQAAGQSHFELANRVNQRLVELELAGEVTDDLLARLRFTVQMSTPVDFMANWRLGRALQKRAWAVLTEATAAFHAALDSGTPFGECAGQSDHVAELDELTQDLGHLIDTMESHWGKFLSGNLQELRTGPKNGPAITSQKQECQWEVNVNGQPPVSLQITTDEKGHRHFLAEGKPLSLNATQLLLLKRHEQRINEILLEAAGKLDNTTRQ